MSGKKLKKIAGYPAAVAIGRHAFAAFADSHEQGAVLPYLATRLAKRTGHTELLPQAADTLTQARLGGVLCNLLWCHSRTPIEPVLQDAGLPSARGLYG